MISFRWRKNYTSFLIVIIISLFLCAGCAFTPKPVYLSNKPTEKEKLPLNGVKLSLVVIDTRPDKVKKAHLCGIMRNSYMIPTSFAFLAHKENLDAILATHIKDILEKAGYKVLKTIPEISQKLSNEKLENPPTSKNESKQAIKEFSDENKKDLKASKGKKDSSTVEEYIAAPGEVTKYDIEGVDAVLEVKIDKYSSDVIQAFLFVSTQAWSKLKVAAIAPDKNKRKVLFGKTVTGYGTSGPRQIITEDCYIIAVNMSHWKSLYDIEEIIRSDDFLNKIKNKSIDTDTLCKTES